MSHQYVKEQYPLSDVTARISDLTDVAPALLELLWEGSGA